MARRKDLPPPPPATTYKRIGSYPGASVVTSIATALFLIGAFALFILHADRLKRLVQANLEVQVFLDREVSDSLRADLGRQIGAMDFVDVQDGQPRLVFISKEEAAQELMKETGENFVRFIGDNPLRHSFVVKVKSEHYQNDKLTAIRDGLQHMPGVYEVVYVESLIDKLNDNIVRAETLIVAFSVILFIVAWLLMNSAVRSAMFSQRFLIRSMQLVGATGWFITRPFLGRAVLHGFVGGVLASGLLALALYYVNLRLPELSVLHDHVAMGAMFGGLICLGMLVCVVSAKFSVNKYLYRSLDQLA
jgi:cell division transport system permease protein